ncbi:pentapeptide repeat-containing protein [Pseudomonas sp. GD03766]|uniref:anti-phage Hailong system effector protein HalA n=1 Tax=Pseudomonas TaxID=286 RepID=UPI0024475DCC|nr:pentapeptide repeat-containing protein [Pseudomonas sp. GD03766]MDH1692593.1 pentapeptide repeat-containing protein [Pseudomonas sp. GD03766]
MSGQTENVAALPLKSTPAKRRNKRTSNYWDVLYKPGGKAITERYDWNIEHNNGPRNSICGGASKLKLVEAKFSNCDFEGGFSKMTFTDCTFKDCDFASTWRYIKFNGCVFESCSFSMSTFSNCKFSGCSWKDISVSGSETKFEWTVIDNPRQFMAATFVNLDENTLKNFNKTPSYQKFRHEHTKSKISKRLYENSKQSSDESIYYECVRLHLTQSLDSKIYAVKHQIESGGGGAIKNAYLKCKSMVFSAEQAIISISGWINGWGGSLVRPAALGVFLILLFAVLYSFFETAAVDAKSVLHGYPKAVVMAMDITLLFGYTKHISTSTEAVTQFIAIANAVLGLWWYAIFVPTVINRICKVRS